jgi:hypothetical protein
MRPGYAGLRFLETSFRPGIEQSLKAPHLPDFPEVDDFLDHA